jgi:hypothetical protein
MVDKEGNLLFRRIQPHIYQGTNERKKYRRSVKLTRYSIKAETDEELLNLQLTNEHEKHGYASAKGLLRLGYIGSEKYIAFGLNLNQAFETI